MSSGSDSLALQGAQVLHQLLRTGHPQQDRADPLTGDPQLGPRRKKRELVGNNEHPDFRGSLREEGPPRANQSVVW